MKTYSAGAQMVYHIYIYILDKYLDASVGVYFFNMNLDIVRQWIICLERKNTLNINNTAAATLGLLGFFISFFFYSQWKQSRCQSNRCPNVACSHLSPNCLLERDKSVGRVEEGELFLIISCFCHAESVLRMSSVLFFI